MPAGPPEVAAVLSGTPRIGETADIDAIAAFVGAVAQDAEHYRTSVHGAARGLCDLSGVAVSRISERLTERLIPGADLLRDSTSSARRALRSYAVEVDRIHTEAELLHARTVDDLAEIATAMRSVRQISRELGRPIFPGWREPPPGAVPEPVLGAAADGLDELERAAAARAAQEVVEASWRNALVAWTSALARVDAAASSWAQLIDDRRRAEQALTDALDDTALGQLLTMASGGSTVRTIAAAVSGEVRGRAITTGAGLRTSHPLLALLLGTENGDGVVERAEYDPAAVAEAWSRMSAADRERLIAEVPAVIGNLPGLPVAVRDQANRAQVAYFRERPDRLDAAQLRLLAEIQTVLNREAAQIASGRGAVPPIQILTLDIGLGRDGAVPTAALAYGDADTAATTTWMVPGMDNDAATGLPDLDEAAQNLFAAQQGMTGLASGRSVIAWLGYDTPGRPNTGDLGVFGSRSAVAGAERLSTEIDGVRAARTRGEADAGSVHVVAHSYGTTVASIALTRLVEPVDSLIMLGSAGLDTDLVPNIDAVNVRDIVPGQAAVFTTHAAADWIAPAGAGLSGRGQPNPDARTLFGIQNFSPVYGGVLTFSAAADPELGLLGTDGHSLIGSGERAAPLGAGASAGHGYADPGTASLRTVAAITTGHAEALLGDAFTRTEPERVVRSLDLRTGMILPKRVAEGVR